MKIAVVFLSFHQVSAIVAGQNMKDEVLANRSDTGFDSCVIEYALRAVFNYGGKPPGKQFKPGLTGYLIKHPEICCFEHLADALQTSKFHATDVEIALKFAFENYDTGFMGLTLDGEYTLKIHWPEFILKINTDGTSKKGDAEVLESWSGIGIKETNWQPASATVLNGVVSVVQGVADFFPKWTEDFIQAELVPMILESVEKKIDEKLNKWNLKGMTYSTVTSSLLARQVATRGIKWLMSGLTNGGGKGKEAEIPVGDTQECFPDMECPEGMLEHAVRC